ncbi:MAG: hypothetical protein EU530_11835 [Promethearchaeota archaeon]|nr:MAG: hypothetical protein EU530_11835 [Candidatus Lokiarchaeota archaeon]
MQMELPRDSIILAKTHPPMYLIHKYWARKPHNVVKAYIEKYTKPGDIVLDPFCGSGVTNAESILAGRNTIGVDINPISILLTQSTITPINIARLDQFFKKMREEITPKIGDFYDITCPSCNKQAIINQLIWINTENDNKNPPKEEIEEIRYHCSQCKKKNHIVDKLKYPQIYAVEKDRVDKISTRFDEYLKRLDLELPDIPLQYQNGSKYKQIRHYIIQNPTATNLFTKRNLIILAILKSTIDELIPKATTDYELKIIRKLLLLTFSANIGQSSKMVWVISNRKNFIQRKKEVGSWTHHFYWNPKSFFEINPALSYFTRASKSLRAQKNLQNRMKHQNIESIHMFEDFDQFNRSTLSNKICLLQQSVENLPLADNSIDYIFTDPPYGDSIQYFELSTLWNKWLDIANDTQETEEIVINSHQKKSNEVYFQKLESGFKECYRVLKNDAFMTITFHNTNVKIRNGLIRSVLNCGFTLNSLVVQMPARNSLKSYLHYDKSPIGDYFLRFQKKPNNPAKKHLNDIQLINIIKKTVKKVLSERNEPTRISFLYNCIDEELALFNSFPLINPSIVEKTLAKMEKENQISISDDFMVGLTVQGMEVKLSLTQKIIEYLDTLDDLKKKTNAEVYNVIYERFNGRNTPDRKQVSKIIEKTIKKINDSGELSD